MDILSNLKYAKGSEKIEKELDVVKAPVMVVNATKGMNGQMSRSGSKHKAWFEGGQMPLQRRVPKVWFTNIFKIEYQVVNLNALQKLVDAKKIKDTEN